MYGAHEPREDPLGSQQKRTFCFFGPELFSVVYFPLKGLSRLHQRPRVAFSSSVQDLALAQGQQEVEEGEEEVHRGLGFVGFLWGRHLVPPLHEFPQTLARFGAISSTSLSEESST